MAPFARIQATATDVSRPPEKAMPTRSPTGSDVKTLLTGVFLGYASRLVRMTWVVGRLDGLSYVRPGGPAGVRWPTADRSRRWPSWRGTSGPDQATRRRWPCSHAGGRPATEREGAGPGVFVGSIATVMSAGPATGMPRHDTPAVRRSTRSGDVHHPERLDGPDAELGSLLGGPFADATFQLRRLPDLADVLAERRDLDLERVGDVDPRVRLVAPEQVQPA